MEKVVRSVCYFTDGPAGEALAKVSAIAGKLSREDFEVQTKRICSSNKNIEKLSGAVEDKNILLSVGTLDYGEAKEQLDAFYSTDNLSFNIDLSEGKIEDRYVKVLFDIIQNKPANTFNFTYVFNNEHSSPYFPSANHGKNGFSVGLQPTDLSEGCSSLEEWLGRMREAWVEIFNLFKSDKDFLGIDSSIAPIFNGNGSLVNFIKRLGLSFNESVMTDIYLKITEFIKKENPKPVGLCGLMFPCLEDFELADEYEQGNFSVERNIYLSLHSGLGIDTYPIGVDEKPANVLNILSLLQGLSRKYRKPLSARFVSDGMAKVGEKTDFKNQYLKDVVVRAPKN